VDEATDVTLSNEEGDDKFTVLRVEAPDRPGLLTDLVQTLRGANVSVVAASIRTHGATAVDVFKRQFAHLEERANAVAAGGAVAGAAPGSARELRRQGVSLPRESTDKYQIEAAKLMARSESVRTHEPVMAPKDRDADAARILEEGDAEMDG
jgi:hypothetical protein